MGDTFSQISDVVERNESKRKDNQYTNFYRNFKFFVEKLDVFNESKLNDFAKMLLKSCQVISIISYQTEEAIEIFNSLNSTGLPLRDADIFSAKMYSAYQGDLDIFTKNWSNIIKFANYLESKKITSIDEIFNQYMYILRAKFQETNTTLPSVRNYFTDRTRGLLNEPDKIVADLLQIENIWTDTDDETELKILRKILLKQNSNFKLFYATFMYFKNNESEDRKIEYSSSLLKLFVLLAVLEVVYSTANFKIFLISLNMQIGNNVKTKDLTTQIVNHIKKEFNKEIIIEAIKNSTSNNSLVFLNDYLFAKEKGLSFSLESTTVEIEHIMPSSGKNIESIREDAGMSIDEFKEYANKIGNKILLEKNINASISNTWFRTKKQSSIGSKRGYKDSVFPIAKTLIKYSKDVWEKEDIDKATEKAATRIANFIFD